MSRIGEAFARARAEDRAALVTYLCAGDPDLDASVEIAIALANAGADVIELGVPFSDPTADGPAIQRASARSLSRGTTLAKVLGVAEKIREKTDAAILLFGYYNPILSYGEVELAGDARAAGVDGCLVVDLPPEHCEVLREPLVEAGLDYVPLIAPTTTPARVELASSVATAFVYYVSLTGVTGTTTDLVAASRRAAEVRAKIGKPVAVGFGVQSVSDVATVAASADGVVVGSAIVRAVEAASDTASAIRAVSELVTSLRKGVSRAD